MVDYETLEAENRILRKQLYWYRMTSLFLGLVIVIWTVINLN